MANLYSLSDVTLSIEVKDMSITIEPYENLVGSVRWGRDEDAFTRSGDANGGNVIRINKNKGGYVEVEINQLSGYIKPLRDLQNKAEANPNNYLGTITIKHKDGLFTTTAKECLPTKHPDREWGEQDSTYSFRFLCNVINEN